MIITTSFLASSSHGTLFSSVPIFWSRLDFGAFLKPTRKIGSCSLFLCGSHYLSHSVRSTFVRQREVNRCSFEFLTMQRLNAISWFNCSLLKENETIKNQTFSQGNFYEVNFKGDHFEMTLKTTNSSRKKNLKFYTIVLSILVMFRKFYVLVYSLAEIFNWTSAPTQVNSCTRFIYNEEMLFKLEKQIKFRIDCCDISNKLALKYRPHRLFTLERHRIDERARAKSESRKCWPVRPDAHSSIVEIKCVYIYRISRS